jgi:uncharacterized protein YbjQ (UPF0145 family)
MTDRYIPTSTTDTIPAFGHRAVARSSVAWGISEESLAKADRFLTDWARDNGFDAIVGVRYQMDYAVVSDTTNVSIVRMNDGRSITGKLTHGDAVRPHFLAYGTAVQFAVD